MKRTYVSPELHVVEFSSEGILCSSIQEVAFVNEGYSETETLFNW
jgi:hypothetical protein